MTAPSLRSDRVEAFDEAASVPAAEWDALLGRDDFYLSSRWLRVVEAEAGVPMHYLMHRPADAAPATAAPATAALLTAAPATAAPATAAPATAALATAEVDASAPWRLGRPDTLLAIAADEDRPGARECIALLPPDLGAALLPGLVCGGRHLGHTTVLRGPHATPADVPHLVATAERLAAARRLRSVSFLYVDESDAALREVLHERGYLSYESAQSCRLPLPTGGYDGYQQGLSTRRRKRVRAERRKIAAAGVRTSIEPLTAGVLPRLGVLEAQLFARYGMPSWLPELSERFLARVLDVFGADALVSLASADGEIRAFGLLLRLRDQWFVHRVGFDYAFQTQHRLTLYYEVMYYTPVELAAAAGITAIHHGTGSVESKRSRGCAVSTQHAYVLPLSGGPVSLG